MKKLYNLGARVCAVLLKQRSDFVEIKVYVFFFCHFYKGGQFMSCLQDSKIVARYELPLQERICPLVCKFLLLRVGHSKVDSKIFLVRIVSLWKCFHSV